MFIYQADRSVGVLSFIIAAVLHQVTLIKTVCSNYD